MSESPNILVAFIHAPLQPVTSLLYGCTTLSPDNRTTNYSHTSILPCHLYDNLVPFSHHLTIPHSFLAHLSRTPVPPRSLRCSSLPTCPIDSFTLLKFSSIAPFAPTTVVPAANNKQSIRVFFTSELLFLTKQRKNFKAFDVTDWIFL